MVELAKPRILTSSELSNEDYHASAGLSASQLKHLHPDLPPRNFWRQSWLNRNRKFEPTSVKSLKFGQAAHMLLLEGEEVFNENWEIKRGVKETTIAGMLAEGEYNMLLRIRDELMDNPLYANMIKGCESEVSILAEREVLVDFQAPTKMMNEIVPVRTRLDLHKPSWTIDLKFTEEVTKESVAWSITNYGYDRQADHNLGVLKLAYPEIKHQNFITIFAEKTDNYPNVLAVTYHDDLLSETHRRNEAAVTRYAQMQRQFGTDPEKPWPSFPHRVHNVVQNGTGGADDVVLPMKWDFIG